MKEIPGTGMGTAGIGNLYAPVSDADARATMLAAWAAGFRYFDTAPHYGFGLAERRLGDALAELDPGQSALVSTKVGRLLVPCTSPARERHGFVDANPFEPCFDYSGDAILRSYEESLARLRRDRIDILLVHDLGEYTHGANADCHMRTFLNEGYRALADLKSSGAVSMIGIGVNETAVCEYLLDRLDFDVVLLAGRQTLLDQSAAERVLPLCAAKGVRFIAGAPYNSGILSRPLAEGGERHYDYCAAPSATIEQARAVEQVCRRHCVSLPAAALQFPLRHPAVGCVLVGLSRVNEVQDHVARSRERIPGQLWEDLEAAGLIEPTALRKVRAA